jgi:hypothetical protein
VAAFCVFGVDELHKSTTQKEKKKGTAIVAVARQEFVTRLEWSMSMRSHVRYYNHTTTSERTDGGRGKWLGPGMGGDSYQQQQQHGVQQLLLVRFTH